VVALALGSPGGAHLVDASPSLHLLVADADVVARARIVDPHGEAALSSGERRPVVEAEILEVFKGEAEPGLLRFAQHGHGVASFEKTDEVLLFLQRIERSREMGALRSSDGLRFVSLQEHDAKYPVSARNREALLGAVRAYVRIETLPTAAERVTALREVTVSLLTSGDTQLAGGALRDLVLARDLPLVTAAELPVLEPLLADPGLPVGLRAGLLAELDRRGLVDGPTSWVSLLGTASGPERPAAARAAGGHPSPAVTAALARLLESDDPATAQAAAIALGNPAHASAEPALARCLTGSDARLRMAAIRGLGGMGTPEAVVALREAADSHPDPATRRRARAEVTSLGRRSAAK
jgi:hypothetical protein